MSAQQQYELEASAALADVQSGNISQHKWNLRQKKACEIFFAAQQDEKIGCKSTPMRKVCQWCFP